MKCFKFSTIVFIALLFLSSCKKSGDIVHKIFYTTSEQKSSTQTDTIYSQFGTYMGSITPQNFSAKLNILMYLDDWDQSNQNTHMISYIDGHDNDPNYSIFLYADFSNDQEVSVEPILYGTDKWNGIFRQKEILFDYFFLIPYYYSQTFVVPSAYGNNNIMGNNGTYYIDTLSGNRMFTAFSQPFLEPIFGSPQSIPFGVVFGHTDSTYIYNSAHADVPKSENNPWGGTGSIIRSNKFTPLSVTMPDGGETIVMYSTISFDTQNLIQIYAGNDNIPYTMDDVFVYAPNYWERMSVKLEIR